MSAAQEQISVDAIAGIRRQEYERGIAEGERRERAAVVAWLRSSAEVMRGFGLVHEYTAEHAIAIEAGEHKEGA